MIADGRSAWVLETTARSWAARSVEGAGLTNALTLGSGWQIGSRGLERHAIAQGFWSGEERLDFGKAYSLAAWPRALTSRRQAAADECLAGPPLTMESMKGWLRDHGATSAPPRADRDPGDADRYSVCMHADPMSMTTASLVTRLPEETGHRPWPVWISFATPCTGIFIPVYLEGVIPFRLASAGVAVEGDDVANGGAWDAFRRLQERATADFAHAGPILEAGWKDLERSIEGERVRAEQDASTHLAADRRKEASEVLTAFMNRTTDRAIATAVELAAAL